MVKRYELAPLLHLYTRTVVPVARALAPTFAHAHTRAHALRARALRTRARARALHAHALRVRARAPRVRAPLVRALALRALALALDVRAAVVLVTEDVLHLPHDVLLADEAVCVDVGASGCYVAERLGVLRRWWQRPWWRCVCRANIGDVEAAVLGDAD